MPRVNGIEVLAAMRQQAGLVAVPVLVTTGTATTAFELRDFGPLRVMRKPFELARLVRIGREMLGGTEAEPQTSG